MKIRGYIRDKRYFILFYFFLIGFIFLVILLDSNTSVSLENIFYINLVGFFLLLFYLTVGYIYYSRYYNSLEELVNNVDRDLIYHLPEPITYQQKIYNKLLTKIYNEQREIIEKQNLEKRENKEFVTTWFHQIKTPIAVSRLIMEDSTDKTKKDLIKDLTEEIDKIESQVEQALYYSKIDVFEKDYFIQQLSLNEIVSIVIKKHARVFIGKKIVLDKEDIKNIMVNSDKKWLSFIIDQILSNSLKYTEKKGRISIRGEKYKDREILIIRDSGIGIKEEDLPRVFDKGFTGYIGRREEKSTGIGLYLAKKLAKRLGHDINIKSKFGEYTEVKIIFPRLTSLYDITKG